MGAMSLIIIKLLIPIIWWNYKGEGKLFDYIGLKPVKFSSQIWIIILMGLVLIFLSNVKMLEYLDEYSVNKLEEYMSGEIGHTVKEEEVQGLTKFIVVIISILLMIVDKFSSYVFKYGFVLKRLVEKLGENMGIFINSIIFSGLGSLILMPIGLSTRTHMLLFLVGFVTDMINGTLSENIFHGCILPGFGITIIGELVFSIGNFI